MDLYQEKVLKFQKYYDLSVSERDALQSENIKELIAIFHEKDSLQKQINSIDKQVESIQNGGDMHDDMDKQQSAEMEKSVEIMVRLLQKIVDYEEQNKLIALSRKESFQQQLQELSTGDMMLKGYSNRTKPNPRFIDQAR